MTEPIRQGLTAAIQFDLNLFQVLCLITIVKPWFAEEVRNDFMVALEYLMSFFYRPIRLLTGRLNLAMDIAPFVFLAILIPLQMISSVVIRNI